MAYNDPDVAAFYQHHPIYKCYTKLLALAEATPKPTITAQVIDSTNDHKVAHYTLPTAEVRRKALQVLTTYFDDRHFGSIEQTILLAKQFHKWCRATHVGPTVTDNNNGGNDNATSA
jgi:hypothetical protein